MTYSSAMPAASFPRHIAALIPSAQGCSFAGNHIAARIAFDHDTGLLLALLCRSGVTLLAVFSASALAGAGGLLPGGMNLPAVGAGWPTANRPER